MRNKKRSDFLDNIICECGYQNKKESIQMFGTCKLCNKVLDPKAKFNYDMYCKLHLWKNKGARNGRKVRM